MQKFFGSGTDEALDETSEIKRLDLDKPVKMDETIDDDGTGSIEKTKGSAARVTSGKTQPASPGVISNPKISKASILKTGEKDNIEIVNEDGSLIELNQT